MFFCFSKTYPDEAWTVLHFTIPMAKRKKKTDALDPVCCVTLPTTQSLKLAGNSSCPTVPGLPLNPN